MDSVIQIHRESLGWFLAAYEGNQSWTAEGPFDSRKQAFDYIPQYATACGFHRYVTTEAL